MHAPLSISNQQARRLLLYVHGLSFAPHKPLTLASLLQLIEHVGFVQVDSINTVERAHHMILFARNQTYRQSQLAHLLEQDRSVFENWTHDAALIPTTLYQYWKPRFVRERERLRTAWRQRRRPGFENHVEHVLQHIHTHGPVMARELSTDQRKGAQGWWDWHPSKTALEYLWRCGDLAITRRHGFQKVYDLAERVIPMVAHTADLPDHEAVVEWACRSALERLGFATPKDIAGFWATVRTAEVQAWCQRHLGNGVERIMVASADNSPPRLMFARSDVAEMLNTVPPPPRRLRFLSPFDPLVRDRLRIRWLFNFDYRIEVFVPEAQRRYGYYVFPILQGDRFIGRIDIKHRRQEGKLMVMSLWLEPGQRLTPGRQHDLHLALERLQRFIGAETAAFADGYRRT
jgi:uncharacterized protein YcaQ